MKRVLLAVIVVSLFAAGAFLYLKREIVHDAPPEAVIAAENALAVDNSVALAYMDLAHIRKLEKYAMGDGDKDALPMPEGDKAPAMVRLFRKAGVDLMQDTDHVLAGVAAPGPENADWAAVLFGRFNADALGEQIAGHDALIKSPTQAAPFYVIRAQNPRTCEPGAPMALHVTDNRIITGSPALVAQVVTRVQSKAQAAADLSDWRAYRSLYFAALTVTAPEKTAGAAPEGMARMMLGGMLRKNPLEALRMGLRADLTPPGLIANAEITAAPEWINETHGKITAWQQEFAADMGGTYPTLAKLQKYLDVSAAQNTLAFNVRFDRAFKKDIAALPGEVMSQAFQGQKQQAASTGAPQERLADASDFVQIPQNINPATLSFTKGFFEPEVTTGPFGLGVTGASLGEDGNVALTVKMSSGAINTLPTSFMHMNDDDPAVSLKVDGVFAADGQNLMAIETCGRDRNQEPTALRPMSSTQFENNVSRKIVKAEGEKTISLIPGAGLDDAREIRGTATLNLPVNVTKHVLRAPLADKAVETGGARIRISSADNGKLSYDISGRIQRILDVRALNADGKYLYSQGASGMGRMFGEGKSVSRDFAGEIAAVEVYIAADQQKLDYPFTLKQVVPAFSSYDQPKIGLVKPAARAEFLAATPDIPDNKSACRNEAAPVTDTAPVLLCPPEVSYASDKKLMLQMQAAAPRIPVINGNFSLMEVQVSGLKLADGSITRLDHTTRATLFNGYNPQFNTYIDETLRFDIALDAPVNKEDIRALAGKVIYHLPVSITDTAMPAVLGATLQVENGPSLTLRKIAEGSLFFTWQGDAHKIVQIVGLNAQGEPIEAAKPLSIQPGFGQDPEMLKLHFSARPAKLVVRTLAEEETLSVPFAVHMADQSG